VDIAGKQDVAYFPAKYRWDHVFKPVSESAASASNQNTSKEGDNLTYTTNLYQNIRTKTKKKR